ncbi:YkgJ family cysteine cluster protein [Lysobacter sp. TY2-98]|uniref:YkgJ family cysteine cluster protein n=1 Tax=Lysobacter sp. TY2-98 TaxID=2290922 RepID=UPI000E1FCBB0|nr:YkgJ family cysteine cluster protein [Lysobacter sp. TY2-98]AXK72132.1 YkgJ family cysteine cluster protein [Lysobacter sp. TY2-98]
MRFDPLPIHPDSLSSLTREDESAAPPTADCDHCDAVCCRLTVVVQPEDGIAEHLTTRLGGLRVMARDADGWCVAVDSARMCCSIYEARPEVCRRFEMGGPYCEAVREDYTRSHRTIPLHLTGTPS